MEVSNLSKAYVNDPHIPRTHRGREHDLGLKSIPLSPKTLKRYDAVLISTDHTAYDNDMIVHHSKLVIDSRNATVGVRKGREKIVKA